jgi:carbonic anhydrase
LNPRPSGHHWGLHRALRWLSSVSVAAIVLAGVTAPVAAEPPHWDYSSHGGADGWGELTEEGSDDAAFPDCNFAEQSPVNIEGVTPLDSGLSVDYEPTPLDVVNNGHTIQVNYKAGSAMVVDGKTYELLQFHFHSPSEHELDGNQTPLEGHFVHQSADGEYAVLGVMIVAGNPNAAFQEVLDVMPEEEGEVSADGSIEGDDLLPESLSYYAYDGSFTTPPCTEGVKWHVLSEPIEASLVQIAEFRSLEFLSHEGEFVGNARPVQPLNGRLGTPAITPPSTGNAGLAATRP